MKRAVGVVLGGIALLGLVGAGAMSAGLVEFDDGTPDGTETPTPTPESTPEADRSSDSTATGETATTLFDVDILDSDERVGVGQSVSLTVAVENAGDADGTQEVTVGRGQSQSVTLESGESGTVELVWTATEPGTREVTVASENDTATTTVEVLEAAPEFGVEIEGTNAPVQDREPLHLTVNVTNAGIDGAAQTVNLTAGGTLLAATTISLDGGASTRTNLTWEPATPHGEHNLTVATANDTATMAVAIDPIEEPAVAGTVSVMTDDTAAEAGVVTLYGANSGDELASADLAPNGSFQFTGLEPGERYRLEVPHASGTHNETGNEIGGPGAFPTRTHVFTAAEIQQSADLTYGYEIRGADSYRWEFYKESRGPNWYNGFGKYDQTNAYVKENQQAEASELDPIVREVIYLGNETFFKTSKGAPVWREREETHLHHPSTLPHRIVQNPFAEFIPITREYQGRSRVDGSIAHKYKLTFSPDYPNASVYINPNTGYIVRWESNNYYRRGPNHVLIDYPSEITFLQQGDSFSIESPR